MRCIHTVLKTFRIKRSIRSTVWQKLIKWLDAVAVVAVLCSLFAWSSMACTTRQMFSFATWRNCWPPRRHTCAKCLLRQCTSKGRRLRTTFVLFENSTCVLQRHCDEMLGIALIRCLRRVSCYTNIIHGHTKCASLFDNEWMRTGALTNEIGKQQQWQIIWANCMQNAYESRVSFTAPLTMSAKTERRCKRMHGYIFSIYLIWSLANLPATYVSVMKWLIFLHRSFTICCRDLNTYSWRHGALFISWIVWTLPCCVQCACVEASARIARTKQ